MSHTESATNNIINDTLCQQLTPYIPSHGNDWRAFDRIVFQVSKKFGNKPANRYFHVFAQLHIMARIAINNRHVGRYEIAQSIYQHLIQHAMSNNLTAKEVPRYYATHTSNLCVLYRIWANMVGSKTKSEKLRHKSIQQAKLMQRYIEMDKVKRKNIKSNQSIQDAYWFHYNDSKWNKDVYTAKMHSEIANNLHRLCDLSNTPNPQNIRECEYHFNKALEIHTANDFGVDTYYFFDMYIGWIYEVRNDMRLNKKLILKSLKRNSEIAYREFGKLSLENICCYRGLARYFAYYLSKYDVAIKYYREALSLLHECVDTKRVDNIKLDENHPHFFTLHYTLTQYECNVAELYDMNGDWKNALKFYEKVVLSANIALKLNPSNQQDLQQQVLEYKEDAEKIIKRIRKYSEYEKEKCECKKCNKMKQKYFRNMSKKWVKGREKCLQSISKCQDTSLKNMAGAKECAHCKSKKNTLLLCSRCKNTYYCNKKHQKLHWKVHKKYCLKVK